MRELVKEETKTLKGDTEALRGETEALRKETEALRAELMVTKSQLESKIGQQSTRDLPYVRRKPYNQTALNILTFRFHLKLLALLFNEPAPRAIQS